MKKIIWFCLPVLFVCTQTASKAPIEEIQTIQNEELNNCTDSSLTYTWKSSYNAEHSLCNIIPVPKGYKRIEVPNNSFAYWLRHIPLLPNETQVHLYNGSLKGNQQAHYKIIDLDVGTEDLQQCADALMRLRAEYLFATNQKDAISFNFTSGNKCSYKDWAAGIRPKFSGNNVSFIKSNAPDASYANFKKYMTMIFRFCGTASLSKELKPKTNLQDIMPGDVFIRGGFPGHAVIVIDVAQSLNSDERIFLLAQSYMPAQQMHILKNNNNGALNPWYSINFGNQLNTPEWTFVKNEFMQF